jgi:hypothetical protein
MGDLFSRLALRAAGMAAVLRPRQPSLFEPVVPEAAAVDSGFRFAEANGPGLPTVLPSARGASANASPGMAVQRHAALPRAAASVVSLTTAGALPAAGTAAVAGDGPGAAAPPWPPVATAAATAGVPPADQTGVLLVAEGDPAPDSVGTAPGPIATAPTSVAAASTLIATPLPRPIATASAGAGGPVVGGARAPHPGGDPTPTLGTPTLLSPAPLTGTASSAAGDGRAAALPPQARRESTPGLGPAAPGSSEPAAITVRIGSIELRTPPAPAPPARAGSRLMSLDDYLRGGTARRR